jgi:hypothetical protein
MTFDKKPLIPLDSESLDGRTVKGVSLNLERGPLPIYSEDRRLVGKITDITFERNTIYASGVLDADASAALGLPGSGLAAEIILDNGDLRGAAVSTDPAFRFEENE